MMTLSQIMDRHLVAVSPSTSIANAAKLIKSSNVDFLLVVQDGRLAGTLGLADTSAAGDQSRPVSGVMQKPLCLEEGSSVDDAVRYVIEHGLTRLPVVVNKKEMRCSGIVSSTALIRAKKQQDSKQ
jgi:osmoprotectant transport system ATP-binding protein